MSNTGRTRRDGPNLQNIPIRTQVGKELCSTLAAIDAKNRWPTSDRELSAAIDQVADRLNWLSPPIFQAKDGATFFNILDYGDRFFNILDYGDRLYLLDKQEALAKEYDRRVCLLHDDCRTVPGLGTECRLSGQ